MTSKNTVIEIVQQVLDRADHSQTKAINLSDAARKYKVHVSVMWNWAKRGDIVTLFQSPSGRREIYLDEDSVARAAELYHAQPGRGYRPLKILKKIS